MAEPPRSRAPRTAPDHANPSIPDSIEQHLIELCDGLDDPVSIARAIRDRDGRILDFRIGFANHAAAAWAGVSRGSMIGQITGDLLPNFRARGFFDAMEAVVQTGVPFHRLGATFANPAGDPSATATFDVSAIRLGDGFLATWRRAREAKPPA